MGTRDSKRLLLTVKYTAHTVHIASVCIRRDRYGIAFCLLFLLMMRLSHVADSFFFAV